MGELSQLLASPRNGWWQQQEKEVEVVMRDTTSYHLTYAVVVEPVRQRHLRPCCRGGHGFLIQLASVVQRVISRV
jgi:hypothetical protein